jgi:magnesium chelatase subunit I
VKEEQNELVIMPELARNLVEQIAFEARDSEYVDAKSGVSARLTISGMENLFSAAEQRALKQGDSTSVRVGDLYGVIPSITGKVELVYEGEQEGPGIVAHNLVGKAIRSQFTQFFPDPEKVRKQKIDNPYKEITDWFGEENTVDILNDFSDKEYADALISIPGLETLVNKFHKKESAQMKLFLMEFALHGLAEYSMLSKHPLARGLQFKDLLSSMFSMDDDDDDDGEDEFNL